MMITEKRPVTGAAFSCMMGIVSESYRWATGTILRESYRCGSSNALKYSRTPMIEFSTISETASRV